MVILQIVVLLGAIFIGVRLGGIGIGYAGGAGVLVLGLCFSDNQPISGSACCRVFLGRYAPVLSGCYC